MSKRKKPAAAPPAAEVEAVVETAVEEATPPPPEPPPAALEEFARGKGKKKSKRDVVEDVIAAARESEPAIRAVVEDVIAAARESEPAIRAVKPVEVEAAAEAEEPAHHGAHDDGGGFGELDVEMTVNVVGDLLDLPGRDDLDEPTINIEGDKLEEVDKVIDQRRHLRGALEALVFASDIPIKVKDLAKLVDASAKQVEDLLGELQTEYATRGLHLEEVGGGWVFRTSAEYASYVRDLRKERPVRLSRAQVETLAIIAYRQPVTRPEVDDVRGVDSGPVLKLLLERDLVRILGKRDEVGRPIIYGTTPAFLEFFGLNSLKDLPTLKEFTELTEESRAEYEEEIGETPEQKAAVKAAEEAAAAEAAAAAAPAPVDESYEGDDDLKSDDDPTELTKRPDTMVDEDELNNSDDDEDEEDEEDDDDDEDDDEDEDDDDDDDDDE